MAELMHEEDEGFRFLAQELLILALPGEMIGPETPDGCPYYRPYACGDRGDLDSVGDESIE
jgi:hypothetical protein